MAEKMQWQKEVDRESGYRRCLVLHGNVRDLWPSSDGRFIRLSELLWETLSGFTIKGRWDGVDGLEFQEEEQGRAFEASLSLAEFSGEGQGGQEYQIDIDDNANETSKNSRIEPHEAFPAIRKVLASPDNQKPLLIIDWGEHLLAREQDEAERVHLANLSKAIGEQPPVQLGQNSLNSSTGLLVIITPTIAALPDKFYNHDTRIKLISVPKPDLESRRWALRMMEKDLMATEEDDEGDSIEILAEMTDGMNMVDLRNIIALSRQHESTLSIGELHHLYKFGDTDSPWMQLDENRVREAGTILRERVKGQDEAVDHAVTMIVRAHLDLAGIQHSKRTSKPKGTMFFVGPTGVGKTELAKAIAHFVFGDESNCIRFDMSEFSQEHADQRLIGAPPGYVGHEEGGQLTNAVAESPFSVLLFDEIEKAHPRVLDKFLQILEDGRLTDGRGQTVFFSETVIIFTSNIGASKVKPNQDRNEVVTRFIEQVERHFNEELARPELLNRFGDNIVVFDFIHDPEIRTAIMESKLAGVRELLKDRFQLTLEIDGSFTQSLVSMGKTSHGGRGLINVIERELINPMSLFIFEHLHLIKNMNRKIVVTKGDEGRAEFSLSD